MDTRVRQKAASDPQISLNRVSPTIQHSESATAILHDVTERRTTYGSLVYDNASIASSCCLVQEHFLTSTSREFVKRSLSLDSIVHVDISDIHGDGEAPSVPMSLRKCKRMIMRPYNILLCIISWRPFFHDTLPPCSFLWKVMNVMYPNLVILLMLYHFVLQVLICQGKYNIHVDTMPEMTTETPTSSPIQPIGKENQKCNTFMRIWTHNCTTASPSAEIEYEHIDCPHIVPTYIVPSLMHFLAFAYGFLHFRIQEGEQLYSLMERVFLQAYSTPGVQKILIRNSRLYLGGAFIWFLLQFFTEFLYNFTFDVNIKVMGKVYNTSSLTSGLYYSLIVLKFMGMMLVQCVNVAVVLNYCMQCEMLVFHIKGICLRLHEKTLEIKDAMHEILGVRAFISLMNDTMGKMMAFCVVNFAQLTIVGSALLFLNRNNDYNVLAYRTVFPALWFVALLIPLLQAARLTRIGTKLRQISFEMRVFGYQMLSQLDLDSFVLFVSGATLRTKLFGATISPATIILTFGAAIFVILTLMVVDIVTISGYKII